MKMRKKISWLLSFFMVFSLFMGSAGMIVKADGQNAVVRIARQDSTATGTVYYKWDTAADWTEVNQSAYDDTPIEINRPDDSLDHTVHFKVVCGTDTIINHCQVNKNGAQDASLDRTALTSEGGQAFSVSASEQVELILEFRTETSGGGGSTPGQNPGGPTTGETIAVTATAVGGAIGDLQIDGMRIGSGMGTNISGSFTGDKTQRHRVAIAADFGYAFASILVNGTAISLGGTTDNLEFEVAPADSYQIEVVLTTNSNRNYNIVWAPSLAVAEQHGFGNDCVIEHGSVEIISAQLEDGTVVNAEELASGNIADASTRLDGDFGYAEFKAGTKVTIKFTPDYGYQLLSASLNGGKLTAVDSQVSTFVLDMPATDLHLSALFTKSEDKVSTASTKVDGATLGNAENIIGSGNLQLNIEDISGAELNQIQSGMQAQAGNGEIQSYLSMDLFQVVNKGNSNDAWETQLTDLNAELNVTLQVKDEMKNQQGTYYVIREHDGAYEKLPATYDAANGTITFATNKFSAYALVFEAGTSSGGTTPGSGTTGNGEAGNGTAGSSTAGSGTAGNSNGTTGSSATGNSTTGNASQTATVKTGDMTPVGIWLVLALCSGAGAVYLGCRKRIKD
ncbi:MAG: hypothetical protein MR594_00105 [Lachnospiraceae bacterium]|nr:hypothetical protein [Lachnospiraceae bacterium]